MQMHAYDLPDVTGRKSIHKVQAKIGLQQVAGAGFRKGGEVSYAGEREGAATHHLLLRVYVGSQGNLRPHFVVTAGRQVACHLAQDGVLVAERPWRHLRLHALLDVLPRLQVSATAAHLHSPLWRLHHRQRREIHVQLRVRGMFAACEGTLYLGAKANACVLPFAVWTTGINGGLEDGTGAK